MPLESGQKVGPYEIASPLGKGGMGEVYRAFDMRLDRDVAVKILPRALATDTNALARFEREAKAVAALSHPNIITIFDIGSEDGVPYIATELLEGENLRTFLSRGPLAETEVLRIAMAIASGLTAAHAKGIIHRDLKPENVFLTSAGPVKILDFGLARFDRNDHPLGRAGGHNPRRDFPPVSMETMPGVILGTVGYLSPEQARGAEVDARSDVFSTGCVIYEMGSGRTPFRGDTAADTIVAILNDDPVDLAPVEGRLSSPLVGILGRCLEKDADRRMNSARDLVEALEECERAASQGAMSWAPTSISKPVEIPSNLTDGLAVLPLENLSGNEEDEFFANGMTDALIAELAKIGSLRVISRRSIIQYKGVAKPLKEIATELNVANVVEGTVLHSGDRLRISVQLLEGATDRMVWSETYERDMSDILALQREVARSIAREVRIKLTPEEEAALGSGAKKVNPAAAEASLRAVYFIHKGAPFFDKTLEYAEEALRIDPGHAPAHALLAILYGLMGLSGSLRVEEASEKGRASALRAIELDDTLGEAHLSLANIRANYDWDWAGAEAEYRRALEINPGSADTRNFYARLLGNLGRFDEALEEIGRAIARDPRTLSFSGSKGVILKDAGRLDDAIETCKTVLVLEPDHTMALSVIGMTYRAKGMYPEALEAIKKCVEALPDDTGYIANLASTHAQAGDEDEARRLLADLEQRAEKGYVTPAHFAIVYAGLGDNDTAFEYLEKAFEERSAAIVPFKVNWVWEPLRSDPRFDKLVRRIGLPSIS